MISFANPYRRLTLRTVGSAEQLVIDRARAPHFAGTTTVATHQAEGANLSCGDEVHFTLNITDGIITDIRHESRACSICTAAADLLAERLIGKSEENITSVSNEEVITEIGIPLSPMRQKCALLPLHTIQQFTPLFPE